MTLAHHGADAVGAVAVGAVVEEEKICRSVQPHAEAFNLMVIAQGFMQRWWHSLEINFTKIFHFARTCSFNVTAEAFNLMVIAQGFMQRWWHSLEINFTKIFHFARTCSFNVTGSTIRSVQPHGNSSGLYATMVAFVGLILPFKERAALLCDGGKGGD
ncbi:hypothetical protein CDAR_225961 [Caerostris darwini]|uniref:Uncharacterized protein n=1 Tax=Caerostris darwini TaxID=1538125 RepID=A0AAV4VNB6_9ARAC|nr:hypothetical protein CDAR_225961 [Caerostris darwini]